MIYSAPLRSAVLAFHMLRDYSMVELHSVPSTTRADTVKVGGRGRVKVTMGAYRDVVVDLAEADGVSTGVFGSSSAGSSGKAPEGWFDILNLHVDTVNRWRVVASDDKSFIDRRPHLVGLDEEVANWAIGSFKGGPSGSVVMPWRRGTT